MIRDNDSIMWYVLHTYTVDFYTSIYNICLTIRNLAASVTFDS
jgi:hypothetical protein